MPEIIVCPGCGLRLESDIRGFDERYNASLACRRFFDKLSAFTLSLQDIEFVHQTIVDSYAAQHSGPEVKPIATAFALIGLYLSIEMGYTGREVQLAHMKLGRLPNRWARFEPPASRADVTVLDVLRSVNEECYKEAIIHWSRSVWEIWRPEHPKVASIIRTYFYTIGKGGNIWLRKTGSS